jgi:Caudovirus prohead serine protease
VSTERKLAGTVLEVKAGSEGLATATFSTFNCLDKDGDVLLPGAIPDGKTVPISAWNHGSWNSILPVGIATIRSLLDRAEADCRFFLDTAGGKDTWATIKNLGGTEWSYGYNVLDSYPGDWGGKNARIIRKLDLFEVSPVMQAASLGTGTSGMRSAGEVSAGARLLAALARKHGFTPRRDRDAAAREALAAEYLHFIAREEARR